MRRWVQGALLASATCVPASASAFSDYELFALGPLEAGGGGGRYFTTSPVDGYSCQVCHLGGIPPVVQILGLPEDGYVAGSTYDIEISWLYPQFPHSLNLEFVNAAGVAAGVITLPDPASLEPADACIPGRGDVAAHIIPESAPRQVLSMDDCGSSRLRFRFTAPEDPEITFAASVVRTDASEKPEGDGVVDFHRDLHRQGYSSGSSSSSGCSVAEAPRSRSTAVGFGLGALGLALVARLARKNLGRKKRAR